MAVKENMFDKRKNEDRRKQFIEENLDVADQVLTTNPNVSIVQNEENIKETPLSVVVVSEQSTKNVEPSIILPEVKKESSDRMEEQPEKQDDKSVPFKLSLLKKEKIKKDTYNYYLESSIDEMANILGNTMNISKSEVISLLLKSAILSNEDIQNLAESNDEVKNLLRKLKN